MKELTKEEITILENSIKNQIWFDFMKKMYPTAIYKIVNNVDLYPERQTVVDIKKYIRFIDFADAAGKNTIKDIKKFLAIDENLGAIDIESLSDEELFKLNTVILMFPYTELSDSEEFSLSDFLVNVLNELRSDNKAR